MQRSSQVDALGITGENRRDQAAQLIKLRGGLRLRSEKGHLADALEDFGEGFEAIYRFEEIDARAVRKLRPLSLKTDLASAAPAAHALSAPQNKALIWKERGEQAHFKWGHLGVRSLRSLKFGELIAALGLSAHIETRLIDSGLRLVGDLVEERGTFKRLQSLTHFQAEEVHQALAHYFHTCSTGLVSEFENKHFICILLAPFDRRFAHCFLQEYNLQELIPLERGSEPRGATLERLADRPCAPKRGAAAQKKQQGQMDSGDSAKDCRCAHFALDGDSRGNSDPKRDRRVDGTAQPDARDQRGNRPFFDYDISMAKVHLASRSFPCSSPLRSGSLCFQFVEIAQLRGAASRCRSLLLQMRAVLLAGLYSDVVAAGLGAPLGNARSRGDLEVAQRLFQFCLLAGKR